MSRIGIQPVSLPSGVSVDVGDGEVTVRGGKGESRVSVPAGIEVAAEEAGITVKRTGESRHVRAMHGTVRSLIANAVKGVSDGYERALEISGVGYRAVLQGRTLVLNLGYSHPIDFAIPEGIEIQVNGQTDLIVSGIDKQQVGMVAARIRGYAPAEPYKGKGVKYKGEQIRRKVGKAVS